MRTSAARRPHDEERGATLLEFAIVAPIFFLLLLAMVDFGFAYGDYIGLRNGVREGARSAVINPVGTRTCTLASPAPANAATRNLACLTKERIGLAAADVKVAIVLLDGVEDADAVEGGLGDPVVICAETPAKSTSGMTAPFLNGRTISAKAEMRIEVPPGFQDYKEGGISCP